MSRRQRALVKGIVTVILVSVLGLVRQSSRRYKPVMVLRLCLWLNCLTCGGGGVEFDNVEMILRRESEPL